jgi:hypothetical protein
MQQYYDGIQADTLHADGVLNAERMRIAVAYNYEIVFGHSQVIERQHPFPKNASAYSPRNQPN